MRDSILLTALAASSVSAHGLILKIIGANGVEMPGATVIDGTPRDCVVNACGAQADTGIIRDNEIASGKYGPLGWTPGGGPVDIEASVINFMCPNEVRSVNNTDVNLIEVRDEPELAYSAVMQRREKHKRQLGGLAKAINNIPFAGILALGGEQKNWPKETSIADSRCLGRKSGLPTSDSEGRVTMIYRQINQDGGGPMTAAIDGTSGAKDPDAFKTAEIIENVPGSGISGLSFAVNTNWKVVAVLPKGMICKGVIAGVPNCCVVRLRNQALAGPFGGAGVFTQSPESRKRAIAYRLRKRMEIGSRSSES